MRQFLRAQWFCFSRGFLFMLMQFFFSLLSLFFIKFGKHINNLPPAIIAAVFTNLMGKFGLRAMAAFCKLFRLKGMMRPYPIPLPFCMLHPYNHKYTLTKRGETDNSQKISLCIPLLIFGVGQKPRYLPSIRRVSASIAGSEPKITKVMGIKSHCKTIYTNLCMP